MTVGIDLALVAAMREALALAQSPDAPYGENPRVGCVIVDPTGAVVGRGYHRGAGTPHAEVEALVDAGARAAGATAVVTLEPCRHTGRTGPCTTALIAAGIAHVAYAQPDPTVDAGGGSRVLADAGLQVTGGVLSDEARSVNQAWTFAVVTGRPLVTWKAAVSLDGRVAGPSGGPTAITGAAARLAVHELRSEVGAIIVGTGTALADDPALTVRLESSVHQPAPPLRVVLGTRSLPAGAQVLDDRAPTLLLDETEPSAVLGILYRRGVRHALLEGGPTLARSFLQARLVDRVEWYLAPVLLGDGPVALPGRPEWAVTTGDLPEVDVESVSMVGEDVRIVGWIKGQRAGE